MDVLYSNIHRKLLTRPLLTIKKNGCKHLQNTLGGRVTSRQALCFARLVRRSIKQEIKKYTHTQMQSCNLEEEKGSNNAPSGPVTTCTLFTGLLMCVCVCALLSDSKNHHHPIISACVLGLVYHVRALAFHHTVFRCDHLIRSVFLDAIQFKVSVHTYVGRNVRGVMDL